MRFYFLGTSAGVPTIGRNVTSLAINFDNQKFWDLVDCGEGTQQQILRSPLSLAKVRRIFITHLHGDHIYGLPGLLTSRGFSSTNPISIYGPVGIKKYVTSVLEMSSSHLKYEIKFYEFDKSQGIYQDDKQNISVVALDHNIASFAYSFELKQEPKLLVEKALSDGVKGGKNLGKLKKGESIMLVNGDVVDGKDYLQERKSIKYVVGGDNANPALLSEVLQGVEVFIHEATHTQASSQKVGYTHKHSTAYDVAKVAEQAKVNSLILTHFSTRFNSKNINDIYMEAQAVYRGDLFLAKDHQEYILNKSRKLNLIKKKWRE